MQIIQGKSYHGIVMLPVLKPPLSLFNSKQCSEFQERSLTGIVTMQCINETPT